MFDGDAAVAWCEYGTPEELPNIYHRKEYGAGLDKAPASFLYNRTRSMFEAAGFSFERTKGTKNCVMRMTVRAG